MEIINLVVQNNQILIFKAWELKSFIYLLRNHCIVKNQDNKKIYLEVYEGSRVLLNGEFVEFNE